MTESKTGIIFQKNGPFEQGINNIWILSGRYKYFKPKKIIMKCRDTKSLSPREFEITKLKILGISQHVGGDSSTFPMRGLGSMFESWVDVDFDWIGCNPLQELNIEINNLYEDSIMIWIGLIGLPGGLLENNKLRKDYNNEIRAKELLKVQEHPFYKDETCGIEPEKFFGDYEKLYDFKIKNWFDS